MTTESTKSPELPANKRSWFSLWLSFGTYLAVLYLPGIYQLLLHHEVVGECFFILILLTPVLLIEDFLQSLHFYRLSAPALYTSMGLVPVGVFGLAWLSWGKFNLQLALGLCLFLYGQISVGTLTWLMIGMTV